MADTDCASESASSIGDEERVRRLFQACDANGDGYIDSQDLLAICRELSLEDSLDELMLQLGADSQGRISYEQFLNRRLALRPEIDALKSSNAKDNISDYSQGKLDSWEWDSGARDMSPVPKNIIKKYTCSSKKVDEEMYKANLKVGISLGDSGHAAYKVSEAGDRLGIEISYTVRIPPTEKSEQGDVQFSREALVGYTDGSYITSRQVSEAGFFLENRGVQESYPLGQYTTVFQADVYALLSVASNEQVRTGPQRQCIQCVQYKEGQYGHLGNGDLKLQFINHNDRHNNDLSVIRQQPDDTHMHPNFLYGKILPDGKPNFLTDYEFSYRNCNFGAAADHSKCCVGGHFGNDLTFGHLYTISKNEKEERTYDEPYSGDLPRRSWLCCPGSEQHVECDQPPLLEEIKTTPSTPSEAITKAPSHNATCHGTCERLQQQLDEQAQRYEEQLTELHSVIAELTRKLHQQRTMAIAEEDEVSESCTSAHEESVTCPLEVSELEPLDNEFSDLDNKLPFSESPLELPEPKLTSSHHENTELSPYSEVVDPLKQEITTLKQQLHEAHTRLAQMHLSKIDEIADEETVTADTKNIESPESHIEIDCEPKMYQEEKVDIKYSNIVPIHKTNVKNSATFKAPITKVAERIKLKRAADGQRDISPNDLLNSELSTAVAEHIVGDILRQCDLQAEKQSMDLEIRKVNAKLEHARSQNTVLALALSETKAHCDRLALLCGKYESNAIALRLALGLTDRAIEAYDVLLALLETELTLNEENPESVQNRTAAETVARQLLSHLDSYQSTDVLLSPWQNHVYSIPLEINEPWTTDHELRLREHVSRLKAERSNVQGTYVTLESTQVENVPMRPSSSQEARKMDLEMAVLMQELMGLREDKSELISKMFVLEKEKSAVELKLKYVEGQQKAQSAALKNLQGQLKDTEALLAIATQHKERGNSDAEHAQGVELELMQALARESRLKVRLQELVTTLEQVTKNAEARLLEGREIVQDLNHTNSILADTVDRNNKKYQAKFKKMEHQMLSMVEKHSAQVQTLQHKIATLETPPSSNTLEKSTTSITA